MEKLKNKKKNWKWKQFIFDLNFVRIGASYDSIQTCSFVSEHFQSHTMICWKLQTIGQTNRIVQKKATYILHYTPAPNTLLQCFDETGYASTLEILIINISSSLH